MPDLSSLLLIAATILGPATQPALESATGSIAGVVLEQTGTPLAEATVFAIPEKDGRRQLRAQTDAQGRFVLRDVPAGFVYINAFKERAGYPYNFFAFFNTPGQDPPPKAEVSARQTTEVSIRLGGKAAALKLRITDSTGTPLNANAEFQRPDMGRGGNYGTSLEAEQVLLVPAAPFRMTVRRDGYGDWHYGGQAWESIEGLLSLQPGETRELAIVLQLAGASATASTGAVQGTVLGLNDEPIAGASVYAEYEGDTDRKRQRVTTTTSSGTFVFNRLEPGNVRLSAWRSDLGYSKDVAAPFFDVQGRQFPVIAAVPGEVASTEIRLGPKNGQLHLLVEDAAGNAIKGDVRLILSRGDSPELLEREVVNGRAFIPVPPAPLRLTVEATGYAPWRSNELSTLKDGLLTLNPGQIVDIRATLRAIR